MSSSELQPSLASGSMAVGRILSAITDVDIDDHDIKQTEDSTVKVIETPYIEESERTKDQNLEVPKSQQNKLRITLRVADPKSQQNSAPKAQQPEAPKSQTKVPRSQTKAQTVQQNQIPDVNQDQGLDVDQDQGPDVNQVACRRPQSKYHEAFKAAFEELRPIAERNGPMDRGKGLNMSHGLDIFDHRYVGSRKEVKLTQLGVAVVVLRMLQKYEETLREQPTIEESTLHQDINTRPVLTAVAIVNALNSESQPIEIAGLLPFAALSVTQPVKRPYVSKGLQVDPSGKLPKPL